MQVKHVLYLSDVSLIFCEIDSAGLKSIFTHSLTDADYIDKFQRFLAKHQPESFSIFLDVMGEEFKHEKIPHIGGKDRELLLDRKCKGLFANANLTWRKHLYREKTSRKDDVYLLISVPLPSAVEHVFDALMQMKQKVSGVYSASILERDLLSALPTSPQSLTVSRILGSSPGKKLYRQTFMKEGELLMSRVTSISGETHEQVFPQLLSEVERMRHFLSGTRQLDSRQKLDVLLALDDAESAQLLQQQAGNDKVNMSAVSLDGIAKNKKLGSHGSFSSLAELLLAYVSLKHVKPHFKPAGLCDSFQTKHAKGFVRWCSAGLLVLSIVAASVIIFLAKSEQAKVDALQAGVAQLERHKNVLSASAQVTELEPRLMKQIVDLHQLLSLYQYGPDRVLSVLSRAYAGFNTISLLELSWVKGKQDKQRRRGKSSGPFTNKLKELRKFKLKVGLPASLGNRVILDRVSDFSNALMEQPEIQQVTREMAAIDTSAKAQIAETLGEGASLKRPVEFTLLITMGLS